MANEHLFLLDKNRTSQALKNNVKNLLDNDIARGILSTQTGYYKSINKGLAKASDFIGAKGLKEFFEDNYNRSTYLHDKAKEGIKNNIVAGVSGALIDPLNFIPLSSGVKAYNGVKLANNLNKAKAIGSEAVKGGAFGAGVSVLNDYGDNEVSKQAMVDNAKMGALIGGVAQGALGSGLPQKIIKNGYEKTKEAINNIGEKIAQKPKFNQALNDLNIENLRNYNNQIVEKSRILNEKKLTEFEKFKKARQEEFEKFNKAQQEGNFEKQDSLKQDSLKQDSLKQDSLKQDSLKQENNFENINEKQNSLNKDSLNDLDNLKNKEDNLENHLSQNEVKLTNNEILNKEIDNLKSFTTKESEESLAKNTKIRQDIEKEFNITPLKDFGVNYAEFYRDSKGAINKLMQEKQGQVSGAFHRDDLGDIDLVWGNSVNKKGYGLSHILDKHIDDFNKLQGDNLANKIEGKLSEVIKNGVIEKTYNGFNVKYQNYIVGLNKGFNKTGNNNWIVTSFENSNGAIKTAYLDSITKSRLSLLNHNDIIPNKNNLIKQDMADGFKRAYANQAINNNLITSLSGAGVGASVNDEDRLNGALLGALWALGGKYALQKGGNFIRNSFNNTATSNLASGLSGGLVGVTSGNDKDKQGKTDYLKTARNFALGALGGLGLKNLPKLTRAYENKVTNKIIDNQKKDLANFINSPDYLNAKNSLEALQDKKLLDEKNYAEYLKAKNNFDRYETIRVDKENLINKNKISLKNDDDFKNITGFIGELRRNFSNTFSKDFNSARDEVLSSKKSLEQDIAGINLVLNKIDENARVNMGEALTSGDYSKLKGNEINIVKSFRQMIDENQKKLLELGVIDKKTFDEFIGNYAAREYKTSFIDKIFGGRDFSLGDLHTRGKEKIIPKSEFELMLARGEALPYGSGGFSKGKWTYDTTNLGEPKFNKDGSIKLRQDYSQLERLNLKENTDIAITLPKTLIRQQELITHHTYLNKIKEFNKNIKDTNQKIIYDINTPQDKLEAKSAGFVELQGDKWGALKDCFVRKDVAYDLQQSYEKLNGLIFNSDNKFLKGYSELLGMWKRAKTIYNSKAHLNNIISNMTLMKLKGQDVSNIANQFKVFKNRDLYNELKTKQKLNIVSNSEIDTLNSLKSTMKFYDEAREIGLFGRGQILDVGETKLKGVIGKIAKKAGNAYELEDNIARLAVYENLRKSGKGMKEAKSLTNDIIPDYSAYMPKGIKLLKDTGLAPFISWSYYIMPKMIKHLGTPQGAKNFTIALGMLEIGQSILNSINNIKENAVPNNTKGKYLNIYKKGDEVTRLKIDRMVPYFEFANNPASVIQVLQSPLSQGLNDAVNISNGRNLRQQFSDMPVTRANKKPLSKAYDYTKYFLGQYTPVPQQVLSGVDLVESLLRKNRSPNSVFIPRNTNQNLLNFLGVNTSNYSQKQSLKRKKLVEELNN